MFKRNRRKKIKKEEPVENNLKFRTLSRDVKDREKAFKQRQREIRNKKFRDSIKTFWLNNNKKIAAIVLTVTTIIILSVVALGLHSNRVYIVQEIRFVGNDKITNEQLQTVTNEYMGQSMLVLSNRAIKDKIYNEFKYLKSVYVDKILPGKLEIYINERVPEITFINLSGIYMVDGDGVVVTNLFPKVAEGLTFEQAQIVAGFGDANSDQVKELYLSKIEKEEDRAKVKWEEIPLEDKLTTMNELKNTLKARLESQLVIGIEDLDKSEFTELPRVFSFDSASYEKGNVLKSKNYLDYSIKIRQFFDGHTQLTLKRILWESEFLIKIETEQNKTFILSSVDDLNFQLTKLTAIVSNNILKEGSEFDLRGEKIVVR